MSKEKQAETIKFIFNADDFGRTKELNQAVYEGYEKGLLTSTSVIVNMEGFEDAINNFVPKLEGISYGIHLNLFEGKSLQGRDFETSLLCDDEGNLNNDFIKVMLNSYNIIKGKRFLKEVETEFRLQIEKLKSTGIPISHIDTHVHFHAIPAIFNICAKLAREYEIAYIRTQYEIPYLVPDIKKYKSRRYFINLIKIFILNFFSILNKRRAKEEGIKTNEGFIGVGYTSYMDENTIKYGIIALTKRKKKGIYEIIAHPTVNPKFEDNFNEYKAIINQDLKRELQEQAIEFTDFTKE